MWRLIRDLRADGVTVLLTTHYLEEAEELSDRISIMAAGRIVREGTVTSLVADHPSTISFRTPESRLPELWAASVTSEDGTTRIRVDDLQTSLTELLRWAESERIRLDDLSARSASLESVFLEIADAAPVVRRPDPAPIGASR